MGKRASVTVISMTSGSYLRMRDIDGFSNNLSCTNNNNNSDSNKNNLNRKPLKRVLKIVINLLKYSSSWLSASLGVFFGQDV